MQIIGAAASAFLSGQPRNRLSNHATAMHGSSATTYRIASSAAMFVMRGLTPRLTGAVARSAQGTMAGHQNREAMACHGVRVEPTVRQRR